jgi:Rrf2 family protein
MKISTKGRYALRLMLDLAVNGGEDQPVSLKDAAQRQGLSDKYLEQIVTPLSRAGLVRSVRGAGGGYLLTRTPSEYTVGDILRPLEGDLAPVECATDSGFCEQCDECVTVELWQEIHRAVSQVVDHTTLADLLERQAKKKNTGSQESCTKAPCP